MRPTLVFLNLPYLEKSIEQRILDICDKITINPERYARSLSLLSDTSKFRLAANELGTEMVPPLSRDLLDYFHAVFGVLFKGGITVSLGMTSSVDGSRANIPPHCDRQRRTAINYLLADGGDNVVTSFYKQTRQDPNLARAENLEYDQVKKINELRLPLRKWHAFDPQRFHSVENIVSKRYMVAITPIYNFPYNRFLTMHSHLIESIDAQSQWHCA